MVHAFILGTNIFISAQNTMSYASDGLKHEFLKILSFYRESLDGEDQLLTIDAKFNLTDGEPVEVRGNQLKKGSNVRVEADWKRVRVYREGYDVPVLDVFQLDEATYHGFGSHIANELSVRNPDFALTIKGDMLVEGAPIWIGDEALHVNNEIFATGVVNAHHGVILSSDGRDYQ